MNRTKLGHRLSSSVLATALVFAPVQGVLAAPAAEAPAEGAEPPAEQPAEGEGETTEVTPPEGEGDGTEITVGGEGEPAPVEIEAPAEPEPPAEEEPAPEETEVEAPPPTVEPGPMRPAEPTWGPKDQYPMTGKGMLIAGGLTTGLGAAFIVTSLLITRCDFDSALSCKFGDQRDFLVPTAVATTGLGLLLIGVGVGNRIKYKRWEKWTPETAVLPSMMPGNGGGVAWVGRF
jgi:hypothetical protein